MNNFYYNMNIDDEMTYYFYNEYINKLQLINEEINYDNDYNLPLIELVNDDNYDNSIINIIELGDINILYDRLRNQDIIIVEYIKKNLLNLSKTKQGSILIQYAISTLSLPLTLYMINAIFNNNIINILSKCYFGNFILQKIFEYIPSNNIMFIINEIVLNLNTIVININGCKIISKILQFKSKDKEIENLLDNLYNIIFILCDSNYGKYIFINIFKYCDHIYKNKLIMKLTDKCYILNILNSYNVCYVFYNIIYYCNETEKLILINFLLNINLTRLLKKFYSFELFSSIINIDIIKYKLINEIKFFDLTGLKDNIKLLVDDLPKYYQISNV